jgi:hypothetical protein
MHIDKQQHMNLALVFVCFSSSLLRRVVLSPCASALLRIQNRIQQTDNQAMNRSLLVSGIDAIVMS